MQAEEGILYTPTGMRGVYNVWLVVTGKRIRAVSIVIIMRLTK